MSAASLHYWGQGATLLHTLLLLRCICQGKSMPDCIPKSLCIQLIGAILRRTYAKRLCALLYVGSTSTAFCASDTASWYCATCVYAAALFAMSRLGQMSIIKIIPQHIHKLPTCSSSTQRFSRPARWLEYKGQSHRHTFLRPSPYSLQPSIPPPLPLHLRAAYISRIRNWPEGGKQKEKLTDWD